jgi:hypothetical protein
VSALNNAGYGKEGKKEEEKRREKKERKIHRNIAPQPVMAHSACIGINHF